MATQRFRLVAVCSMACWCAGVLVSGCSDDMMDKASDQSKGMKITSTAFADGGAIPKAHANADEGQNISPAVNWTGVPAGAKELALIVEDTDAQGFVHWLVYKIPASCTGLKEGEPATETLADPAGALQGANSFGAVGYGGPKPPPGKAHNYVFTLFALDDTLDAKPGLDAKTVKQKMFAHVIAETKVTGTYKR